jgi:hypothetical protein
MKRSNFIKLALNHTSNTLFVNEEQVKVAIELFEQLGMVPPVTEGSVKIEEGENGEMFIPIWRWEEE